MLEPGKSQAKEDSRTLSKKQDFQFDLQESLSYFCLLDLGDVMGWDMMPVANKSKHSTQHTQREVGLGWELTKALSASAE